MGVLMAMLVLMVVTLAMTLGQAREQMAGESRLSGVRAFYAAEGVTNMALREWVTSVDEDADGAIARINGGVVATGPDIGGGRAAATVVTAGNNGTITATSSSDAARRTATLMVRRNNTDTTPGLNVSMLHMGSCPANTTTVAWTGAMSRVGIASNVDVPFFGSSTTRWPQAQTGNYAIRHWGTVIIPTAGLWTFSTYSDDGSVLLINGTQVVGNDGNHSPQSRSGSITLPAGAATIETRMFECSGQSVMQASWSGPGVSTQIIPHSALFCTPETPIPHVAAHTMIAMTGTSRIDAYDSRNGAYGGANAFSTSLVSVNLTSANAISLSNSAQIRGSACIGPGGNPSTGITTNDSSSITGSRTALATAIASPQTAIPSTAPASSGALSSGSGVTSVISSTRYSSITLTGTAELAVSGGEIDIYVDGTIHLDTNARITIAPGSSLTIHSIGAFTVNGSASISGSKPDAFCINQIGLALLTTFNNNAVIVGQVRNLFGAVTLNDSAQVYGGIRANSVHMNGASAIHADLGTTTSVAGGAGAAVVRWTQAQ